MTQQFIPMRLNILFADHASAIQASNWAVPLKQHDAKNSHLASSNARLSKMIQIEDHDNLVLKAKRLLAQY